MFSGTSWILSLCRSFCLLVGVSAAVSLVSGQESESKLADETSPGDAPAKQAVRRIDLSTAINVNLPTPKRDLEAASFSTADGKTGWVLRLPGGRPIATPAYADGVLFLGGGYGRRGGLWTRGLQHRELHAGCCG